MRQKVAVPFIFIKFGSTGKIPLVHIHRIFIQLLEKGNANVPMFSRIQHPFERCRVNVGINQFYFIRVTSLETAVMKLAINELRTNK